MDQNRAPLYEALLRYKRDSKISFHVPGHKDGNFFDREGLPFFASLLTMDGTEVNGLDDLHHPKEAIAEAQHLAAEAFGADQTFFLVGGSTAGNMGTAVALFAPGDQVLVQRNSHKSIFHGLMLSGAKPVYLAPEVDEETGIPLGITPGTLKKGLERFPNVRAVWLTNPNYYGVSGNIEEIATIAHQAGVPLLVDEAHGAHFSQAPFLPLSALECGADLAVQSTHKMLSAMTMGSMLHLKGNRIDRERIAASISMVQSSSPSYPLMASLDLARRHLIQEGRRQLTESIPLFQSVKKSLDKAFSVLSFFSANGWEGWMQDPCKWVISTNRRVSGFALLEMMEEMGLVAEMADTAHVVLALSPGNRKKDMEHLQRSLLALDAKLRAIPPGPSREEMFLPPRLDPCICPALSLQEAFYLPGKQVALKEVAGKFCGEMVIPYPPGVPFLIPGEKIEESHIHSLLYMRESGIVFQGIRDESLNTLRVVG